MTDLPKCRLCGCKYQHVERLPELVHCCNPLCEMSLPRLKLTEWTALMGGGEAVAEASRRAPGGINWLCDVLPDSGTKLYAGPAPAIWNSPDITPNVKRGGSGFFVVAVRRSNGKIYTFPAAYLNKMELSFEDCSVPESGYGCVFEETEDGAICSGWFDWKTHADYDDFYQVLLEDGELVAWAELPAFSGQVTQQSPAPAVDGAVLLEADIKAHMAGQADAGVDPSYSNAQQYAYKAMKGEG